MENKIRDKVNDECKEAKHKNNIKTKQENLKITENSVNINSDEERPGIGYEIFGTTKSTGV